MSSQEPLVMLNGDSKKKRDNKNSSKFFDSISNEISQKNA